MEDKNELNDIILNKGSSASSNKKIILAVATLGVILVIVVMLMNSLSSTGTENLPQAALPPKPALNEVNEAVSEPLFEDVEVVQETPKETPELDKIAQKLKEESQREEITPPTIAAVAPKVKTVTPKKEHKKRIVQKHVSKTKALPKAAKSGAYYVQVGSFSKYEPNKKFLNSITKLHYKYTYHKVKKLNKVLIGPFKSRKEAINAKRIIRAKIEPGAFLIKL